MAEAIGVTGGIACGKSEVCRYLARRCGFVHLDADRLAFDLLRPGEAGWQALVREFDQQYLDGAGEIDRPKLRQALFADSVLRGRVDRLLHPLVRRLTEGRIAAELGAGCSVLVEVPLLYEAGWQDMFSRVVVVYAGEEERRRRLCARDGVGSAAAGAALAAQHDLAEKAVSADYVVDNSGPWSRTCLILHRLAALLAAPANGKGPAGAAKKA